MELAMAGRGAGSSPPGRPPGRVPTVGAVLQIINIVEAYIIDSLQFLQGLLHSHELLATVRAHRDRFLARLLTDLYLNHAASLLRDGAHVLNFILVSSHPRPFTRTPPPPPKTSAPPSFVRGTRPCEHARRQRPRAVIGCFMRMGCQAKCGIGFSARLWFCPAHQRSPLRVCAAHPSPRRTPAPGSGSLDPPAVHGHQCKSPAPAVLCP